MPAPPLRPPLQAPRRTRDRRGRGMRGPAVLPADPASPHGPSTRERFDRVVLDLVADLEVRWGRHLGLVEYAVEDTPILPDDWDTGAVPLSSLVRGKGGSPTRLVLFRRPIERRASGRAELEALVHAVLVEQVADLLGLSPRQVDPRWED